MLPRRPSIRSARSERCTDALHRSFHHLPLLGRHRLIDHLQRRDDHAIVEIDKDDGSAGGQPKDQWIAQAHDKGPNAYTGDQHANEPRRVGKT